MKLSQNIRTLRLNEFKSQEEVAEYMNVSRQTISKWETGNSEPSINDLIRFAQLFKVSLDELVLENIEIRENNINNLQLLKRKMRNEIATRDIDDYEIGNILFPSMSPKDLKGYDCFSRAYYMYKQWDVKKNNISMIDTMNLYEEAIENGIIEANINILSIVVRTIASAKISNPHEPLGLQDRLEPYLESLEEVGHPAGSFYRALVLIYGLMLTEKTEEENLEDGIILMYKLIDEGNELAIRYVDYIENDNREYSE